MPRPAPPAALVPHPSRRRPLRRGGAVVGVLVGGLGLAACAPAVSVQVAPAAADPVCASVVLALPDELAGGSRLDTTSQATAAWGDPAAPIVLRCGVDPLPPTTQSCVTATDAAGVSVDWVAVEGAQRDDGAAPWTFTTYGREPAVEVTVPDQVTADRSTSFLIDLSAAVTHSPQLRTCL